MCMHSMLLYVVQTATHQMAAHLKFCFKLPYGNQAVPLTALLNGQWPGTQAMRAAMRAAM